MVVIKFRDLYVSKSHPKTEWCMVIDKQQAHKFTKEQAIEFVNDKMSLNINNVKLEELK